MTRLTCVGGGLAVLVIGIGSLLAAQPPAGGNRPVNPYLTDADLLSTCARCHRQPDPNDRKTGVDRFILLYESTYWEEHDLHRKAFAGLASKLGRQMSKRLWDDEEAAAKKPACLVCHATDTQPDVPLADKKPDRFFCENGVNCQACHGPAGGEGWRGPHSLQDWRLKKPAEKAVHGQVNLRGPQVRAETCSGCHVGSATKGRFVTHEMYAAGHPPLPPFELATFSRDEPQHWRSSAAVDFTGGARAEIAKQLSEPGKFKELFGYRPGEVEAARLVAVGAVTALRESARLAAAPGGGPLDFAHFNCAACHHELKIPSDRQQAGYAGAPGRPVPQTWPAWVVRGVLRHAVDGKQSGAAEASQRFEDAYRGWRQSFDAAPFGDAAKVRATADRLEKECAAALVLIDATEYTPASARGLLDALAAVSRESADPKGRPDYLDLDGAAQLARAAAAITDELTNPPKPTPPGPQLAKPPGPPAFTSGPLADLQKAVGLTVREADTNTLIQDRGTYDRRAKRAFDYTAGEFRTLFDKLIRP